MSCRLRAGVVCDELPKLAHTVWLRQWSNDANVGTGDKCVEAEVARARDARAQLRSNHSRSPSNLRTPQRLWVATHQSSNQQLFQSRRTAGRLEARLSQVEYSARL